MSVKPEPAPSHAPVLPSPATSPALPSTTPRPTFGPGSAGFAARQPKGLPVLPAKVRAAMCNVSTRPAEHVGQPNVDIMLLSSFGFYGKAGKKTHVTKTTVVFSDTSTMTNRNGTIAFNHTELQTRCPSHTIAAETQTAWKQGKSALTEDQITTTIFSTQTAHQVALFNITATFAPFSIGQAYGLGSSENNHDDVVSVGLVANKIIIDRPATWAEVTALMAVRTNAGGTGDILWVNATGDDAPVNSLVDVFVDKTSYKLATDAKDDPEHPMRSVFIMQIRFDENDMPIREIVKTTLWEETIIRLFNFTNTALWAKAHNVFFRMTEMQMILINTVHAKEAYVEAKSLLSSIIGSDDADQFDSIPTSELARNMNCNAALIKWSTFIDHFPIVPLDCAKGIIGYDKKLLKMGTGFDNTTDQDAREAISSAYMVLPVANGGSSVVTSPCKLATIDDATVILGTHSLSEFKSLVAMYASYTLEFHVMSPCTTLFVNDAALFETARTLGATEDTEGRLVIKTAVAYDNLHRFPAAAQKNLALSLLPTELIPAFMLIRATKTPMDKSHRAKPY